jgi:3-oxoadipate enol-lactonase
MPAVLGLRALDRYPGIRTEAGPIDANGVRLYVERHLGDGADPQAPTVLALHGLGGSADTMAVEVAGLAVDRPVIVLDARGHGRSTRPPRYSLDDHVADAVAVVEALQVDRLAVLGVSMGSYIAPGVAVALAERAVGLVLVVSKGHGAGSSVARLIGEQPERFAGKSAEELALAMFDLLTSPATTAGERAVLSDRLATMSPPELVLGPEDFQRAQDALAGFDNRPLFGRLTCPTLVISGRDDVLNPAADGAELAADIPGARFAVVERAGHVLPAERTPEYLALLRPFLAEVSLPVG